MRKIGSAIASITPQALLLSDTIDVNNKKISK